MCEGGGAGKVRAVNCVAAAAVKGATTGATCEQELAVMPTNAGAEESERLSVTTSWNWYAPGKSGTKDAVAFFVTGSTEPVGPAMTALDPDGRETSVHAKVFG